MEIYWKVKLGHMVVLVMFSGIRPGGLNEMPCAEPLVGYCGVGEKIPGYPIGIDMGHPNFFKDPILASKRRC